MRLFLKTRVRQWLAFTLMFVMGAVVGGALVFSLSSRALVRFFDQPQITARQKLIQRVIARHTNLNRAEKRAVKATIESHKEPHEAQLRQCEVLATPFRRALIKDIRKSLRPHNQSALDVWYREHEKRKWRRFSPPITSSDLSSKPNKVP